MTRSGRPGEAFKGRPGSGQRKDQDDDQSVQGNGQRAKGNRQGASRTLRAMARVSRMTRAMPDIHGNALDTNDQKDR